MTMINSDLKGLINRHSKIGLSFMPPDFSFVIIIDQILYFIRHIYNAISARGEQKSCGYYGSIHGLQQYLMIYLIMLIGLI